MHSKYKITGYRLWYCQYTLVYQPTNYMNMLITSPETLTRHEFVLVANIYCVQFKKKVQHQILECRNLCIYLSLEIPLSFFKFSCKFMITALKFYQCYKILLCQKVEQCKCLCQRYFLYVYTGTPDNCCCFLECCHEWVKSSRLTPTFLSKFSMLMNDCVVQCSPILLK